MQRRILQEYKLIHDYYNDVIQLYGNLRNLCKNEKEGKNTILADGLTGQLFKIIQLINLTGSLESRQGHRFGLPWEAKNLFQARCKNAIQHEELTGGVG